MMADFMVAYTYGHDDEYVNISRVYAVDHDWFLILNSKKNFEWVPMRDCTPFEG